MSEQAQVPVRAGLFSRESKGKLSSIADQDRENESACAERGWAVATRYRERVSASRFGTKVREGWPQITADVMANRIDVLILWEVSRGDRNLETWVPFVGACRTHGVLIHVTSAEMTYDPRIGAHWKSLVDAGSDAAYESEKVSHRAKKGIAGAALAGKQHGAAPYGYDRVYDQADRRQFTQIPNADAAIVVEIIERVAKHDPLITIEKDLNDRGIPSPAGGRWHRNTLRNLALNPTYVGQRRHNGTTHPGNWPPLVSHETWLDAVAVLRDPSRKRTPPGRYKWLLSYRVIAPCGEKMRVAPGVAGRRDRYSCPSDGCTSIGQIELDELVSRAVLGRLALPDARALFSRTTEESSQARADVAAIRAELADLGARVGAGELSATLAAVAEPAILARLAAAEDRVKRLATNAAALHLLGDDQATAEVIRPRWDALSVAGRRSVIDDLIEVIRVGPTEERLTRWSSDEERLAVAADRTEIDWR
jgi:site-specific DNA recombinase